MVSLHDAGFGKLIPIVHVDSVNERDAIDNMAEMINDTITEAVEAIGNMPSLFCGPDASQAIEREAHCAALPSNSLLKLDDYFDVAETNASPVPRAISADAASSYYRARVEAQERGRRFDRRSSMPYTLGSKASYLAGRKFMPRATDVIVATFPKSGTTFMTNVMHQLRSKCELNDFEEITVVCPWICMAGDVGQNLEDEHVADPRVFKSHMNPSNLNPGGRKVLVVRDPTRVILSFFAFFKAKGVPFLAGVPDALAFVDHPFWQKGPLASSSRRGNVWQYVVEIWFARSRDDVLVVPYEAAVADPAAWIRKCAAFTDIPCDDALVAAVEKHSDKAYMVANEKRYDDHWISETQAKLKNSINMRPASKVSTVDHAKPDGLDAAMQAQWAKYVQPHTGHATYDAMLKDLTAYSLDKVV